jgi:hypothetical protein
MATNPQPSHVTAEMWWFVEEWERLEPETVFAGAWGRFKPGYHCDFYTLKHTAGWQNDYSVQLADDQVGNGHPNEHMGAAVDITFPDAQSGNYTTIRKYSDRIRAAWKARDPRLKGWREVLCNSSDGDTAADGFDFTGSWPERTPDDTHKWHMHFSCLRKYLNVRSVFEAMMSILRGETLAQWQSRETGTMATVFKYNNQYWISRGDATSREVIPGAMGVASGEMNVVCDVHRVYPDKDSRGYPATDLKTRDWNDARVDLTFGKIKSTANGGGGTVTSDHTHDFATSGTSGPAEPVV